MTVMKNRYRKSKAKSFDAREILKRWGDFNFGTIQCNELALCALGTKSTDNFYKISGSLKF